MKPTIFLSTAVLGLALVGCIDNSDNNNGYLPTDNQNTNQTVSAEDLALEANGSKSLVRIGNAQVFRATGDITVPVTQLRTILGETLNPNTAGEKTGGRREINWDGVPATVTNNDAFPGNFFNSNSPRGAVLSVVGGSGLRVSDNGFVDVNPTYAGGFNFFSPSKTFAPVGATVIEVHFFVAGSTTPAVVNGFASVFAGVDRSTATKIEYFDASNKLLRTVAVPRRSDEKGLSVAGVMFDTPIVAFVRITTGQAPLSAATGDVGQLKGTFDLVVMDDFLYSEPRAR